MRKISILTVLFISSFSMLYAAVEKRYTQKEYVDQFKSIAVSQMIQNKIPASIIMAQGILESGYGNSVLAQKANNHFGIKCHDWKGNTYFIDDDKPNECFRNYKNAEESYKDHSEFLTGRSRYANLFTLQITDYKGWARGLKAAGYATNPKYPQLLIDLIERLDLNELDNAAIETSNPIKYIAKKNVKSNESKVRVENAHTVMVHSNNIKYVVAKKGDTFYRISKEFQMGLWQLYKYNDYGDRKDVLEEGDIVFLQPKRHRSKRNNENFSVSSPVSLRTISQLEGIKLSSLMDKNNVSSPDELLPKGEKVSLR